jgi:L-Lysine epsilon oxidase N-terminal/L-lysine epsilon oxidase C-terminal domain
MVGGNVVPKLRNCKAWIHPELPKKSQNHREDLKMAKSTQKTGDKSKGPPAKSRTSRTKQRTKRTATVAPLAPNVGLGPRTEYRIYPSIGIARVGNSADGFVIGPEAPGVVPTGPFRGAKDGGIKPQAARFRIYKVKIDDNENETALEEIVGGGNSTIEWSVNLANRKAVGLKIFDTLRRKTPPEPRNKGLDRNKLIITASGSVSGSKTLGPLLAGKIEFAKPNTKGVTFTNIELATLRTDDAGRLLVVGGPGKSGSLPNASLPSFADNDGWYDSVSDGPVSATVRVGGQEFNAIPSWVVVTVPRFAPGIYGVVTWYDQAVSMARENAIGRFDQPRTTSFTRDIYPILKRADNLRDVHSPAHSSDAPALADAAQIDAYKDRPARANVQSRLTPVGAPAPSYEKKPPLGMPKLNSGANPDTDPNSPPFIFLSLTRYQMAHIENWVNGAFDADWPGHPPVATPFEKLPVADQGWALNEAALEACVGGPFFPGIEGTVDVVRVSTYHPDANLRKEFRIDPALPAGFLTEKMALPWQADFADCGNYWWPSQRPDDVTTKVGGNEVRWDRGVVGSVLNGHQNMVDDWSKLGFVVFDVATGKFVETERTLAETA